MSVLTMIRHGQATAFEKNTDRLSPLGEKQARKLAAYWIQNHVIFNEVHSGSLVRQQRTAQIVGECYLEAGIPWPTTQINKGLNEYDGASLLTILAPQVMAQNLEFRHLAETARQKVKAPDRNTHFQKMFEALVAQWVAGTFPSPQVESWVSFRERVHRSLDAIISCPERSQHVAVFTSGGPIGATIQRVLDAPPTRGIDVSWRVRNCSLTEFLFNQGKISLDSFNAIPHLDDSSLHSFR